MNLSWIPEETYRTILATTVIACVDVAIVNEGKILLVKRKDRPAKDQWWLPGGRVFKNELMKKAAYRKALEEVDLQCRVGPIVHTAETIFEDGPGMIPVHSINSCFLLYHIDRNFIVKINEHHSNYNWVSQISSKFHPYVQECLEGAGL